MTEAAAAREEELRQFVREPFLEQFDRQFYEDFGRLPAGSTLSAAGLVTDRRRAAIQALIERGSTEGEREAARAALERITQDAQDEDDYLDAVRAGEA